MIGRNLTVHLGLLAVCGGLALRAWTDDEAESDKDVALVWEGDLQQLDKIEYRTKSAEVVLTKQTDAAGTFFVTTMTKDRDEDPEQARNPHSPHEPHPEDDPAGGANSAGSGASEQGVAGPDAAGSAASAATAATATSPSTETPKERETLTFIAVEDALELVEDLAPLEAKRDLGRLDSKDYGEFGFVDGEEARLDISFGNVRHSLWLGAGTPGSSDVYARLADGRGFVVSGSIGRDLARADSRLLQRNFHTFESDDATTVEIKVGEQSRKLTRSEEKKSLWAPADSPETNDETASNWLATVQRLRVSKYAGPSLEVEPIVRVEYADRNGKALGYVEVGRRTADDQLEYLARSEVSRWWGNVLTSTAEQVAQDLSSVLGP